MLKRLLSVVVLFLISAVVMAQNAGREFYGWQWYDDGITFGYPYSIADNIGSRWIPASGNQPEKVHLFFENYHGDGQWIETGAAIDIIPVSTLPSGLSSLPETVSTLPASGDNLLNQLSQIVQSGDIPVTTAYPVFLEFQSGTGVRFIAAAGGGMNPMRLSYRYLGITTDGSYVVMALFPLDADNLDNLDTLSPEFVAFDATIMSLNITSPDATFLTSQTNGRVNYQSIQFTYDSSLAYRVEVDAVAPVTGAEAEQTMFGVTPGYQRFTFVGFPAVGSIQSPHLYVMPVSEFPNEDQIYGERLSQLQALLCEHPELRAAADPGGQNPLPILPVMNAAQTLVSQLDYLNFGNGQGLRYITYYSQGINPVTAADLFYAFAGMSSNRQYIVAATFPLYAPFLPQGDAANDIANMDDFAVNYQTYLDGLLLQIDVMDGSAYTPQIHLLDAVISSVHVNDDSDFPTVCALEIR